MPTSLPTDLDPARLRDRFAAVRNRTRALAEPLEPEDCVVQSMPDASPTKWHLAHTSWFFETFVLGPHRPGYRPFHPGYNFLFNSYYNAIGERLARPRRGVLSRPTMAEVGRYRSYVDEQMVGWLDQAGAAELRRVGPVVVLGLHHEQQHQELILTDLKHAFAANPLRPAYHDRPPDPPGAASESRWTDFPTGIYEIGHEDPGFAFDNETPRHRHYLAAFRLASRPVTCGEYLAFIEDGGYRRPELWLSDGWDAVRAHGWDAPLYWERGEDRRWWAMTLAGMRPVVPAEPVCHVSYFEADAYARWAGARLPTEAEWELAAAAAPLAGNFVESGRLHPAPSPQAGGGPAALFGDVWEWTASAYLAYPGFAPAAGALGEYNGKFMCNQFVLRGGSCGTPGDHIRATYRNFFPPSARWQFQGVRLAADAG